MTRVLLDTNVFVYAMAGPSSYREPCRAIVEHLATGAIEGEVSVDLVKGSCISASAARETSWRRSRRRVTSRCSWRSTT